MLATIRSYLNNADIRWLAGIAIVGLAVGQSSTFAYNAASQLVSTTNPLNQTTTYQYDGSRNLTTITNANSVVAATYTYDAFARVRTFTDSEGWTATYDYDAADRVTKVTYPDGTAEISTYDRLDLASFQDRQGRLWKYTYDAIGNLTSDGVRTYSWDAESRLVGIGYPGQPGKATAFTYDGLGRRTAIAEPPPGGGPAVTTSYLWCGEDLCQARDATNARTRSHYDEGEFVPGAPAQPYYYGIDQLGSVRRAFASTSSAPAYAYDLYGVPLQVTAPVTNFGYAGLFNHPASGLNLTLYRGYDPVAGRWLSRDPIGEPSDPYGNLYAYVGGNTPNLIDPTGENPFAAAGAAGGFIGGFAGSVAGQLYNSGCVSLGQALGDAVQGAGIGGAGGLLASIFRRAAIALAGRTAAAASVQKSTGIVARDGLNIGGYTRHGVNRAIGDGGSRAGTSPRAILDALRNPARIRERIDGTGRQSRIYTGEDAQVVVNPQTGNIISVNPLAGSGVR